MTRSTRGRTITGVHRIVASCTLETLGARCALEALSSLGSLEALGARCTLEALGARCTLEALEALGSLEALEALEALVSLNTLDASDAEVPGGGRRDGANEINIDRDGRVGGQSRDDTFHVARSVGTVRDSNPVADHVAAGDSNRKGL